MDAFDYIIIGGGTAGCLLAARLPAGASILLLEAGPDARSDPRVATPIRWTELLGSDLDWAYVTEPQKHLHGRRLTWPRGRALGGSGAINAMVYIEGHATDYDSWIPFGGTEWGADALRPHFPRVAGAGIAELASPHPLAKAFVTAARKIGLPANFDFNARDLTGVGLYHVFQREGRRWSTSAYLTDPEPCGRLTIRTGSHAIRVIVRGGRAVAVEAVIGGQPQIMAAGQEIIVSAGTVGSPQLLLLSGIGPADDLRRLGIPVVADRPGVGANLHDHVQVSVSFRTTTRIPVDPTSNLGEAGGFVHTRPGPIAPDLQLSFAPMIDLNSAADFGSGFTIGPAVTRPESRGRLTLASADPAAPPRLDPNYLATTADLRTLADGVALAQEIAATRPLNAHRSTPDASAPRNRGEREEFCRRNAQTQFHPVGTCRLGPPDDPLAVVDSHLRVHGVAGLAVVDASIMPAVPTGNIAAAVHAIARKAAGDRSNG